jgi:hypothetical protein
MMRMAAAPSRSGQNRRHANATTMIVQLCVNVGRRAVDLFRPATLPPILYASIHTSNARVKMPLQNQTRDGASACDHSFGLAVTDFIA